MKAISTKAKHVPGDRLLEECEQLRQKCNKMTDAERRKARQHALNIVYGTDATKPARRR